MKREKGPRAIISRTHPDLVKRLFETEVPEIYDGTVEIKAVSREAGSRTKLAVLSHNPNVDAVGACIGARGARVAEHCGGAGRRKDRHCRIQRRSGEVYRRGPVPGQCALGGDGSGGWPRPAG